MRPVTLTFLASWFSLTISSTSYIEFYHNSSCQAAVYSYDMPPGSCYAIWRLYTDTWFVIVPAPGQAYTVYYGNMGCDTPEIYTAGLAANTCNYAPSDSSAQSSWAIGFHASTATASAPTVSVSVSVQTQTQTQTQTATPSSSVTTSASASASPSTTSSSTSKSTTFSTSTLTSSSTSSSATPETSTSSSTSISSSGLTTDGKVALGIGIPGLLVSCIMLWRFCFSSTHRMT